MKKEFFKKIWKENRFLSIMFWLVVSPTVILCLSFLYKFYIENSSAINQQSKHFLYLVVGFCIVYFFWKQIMAILKKIWEIKFVQYTVITVVIIALLSRTPQGQELLGKLITWGIIAVIVLVPFGKKLKKWLN